MLSVVLAHFFARFGKLKDVDHSPCFHQCYCNADISAKRGKDMCKLQSAIQTQV